MIDRGRHPRPATVGHVCAYHYEQFGRMLDPTERGQVFPPLDGRRVPPSIPVLFVQIETRRRVGEQLRGGAFASAVPGSLTAMALRDPRSRPDPDGSGPWSPLGTLVEVVKRMDVRDIHGQPVAGPGPSVVAHAAWLLVWLQRLVAEDWIADCWTWLCTVQGQLLAEFGDPAPSPVGHCLHVDEQGQRCGTPLWLPEAPPGAARPCTLRCPACDHLYSDAELARLARGQRGAEPAA